jgi:hypothetical protein
LLKIKGLSFGLRIALFWPMVSPFNPAGLAIVARGVSSLHVAVQSARSDRKAGGNQTVTLAEQSTVTGILATLAGYPEADGRQENAPTVFAELADELAMQYECSVYTE